MLLFTSVFVMQGEQKISCPNWVQYLLTFMSVNALKCKILFLVPPGHMLRRCAKT